MAVEFRLLAIRNRADGQESRALPFPVAPLIESVRPLLTSSSAFLSNNARHSDQAGTE